MNRSRVTGDLTASGLLYADIANDRVGIGSTIPGNKLSLPDSAKIGLGNAEDLTVVHDGNNSTISNSTGGLYLQSDTSINIDSKTGSHQYIHCTKGAEVSLWHNNSKKLETTSDGVTVTGELTTGSLASGTEIVAGNPLFELKATGNSFSNKGTIKFFHNTSDLKAQIIGKARNASNGQIYLDVENSGTMTNIVYVNDAGIDVTGTGTFSSGVTVTGGNIDLADSSGGSNNRIQLGTGDDLQVYHDGSNGYVYNSGSGNLTLVGNGNNRVQIRAKTGENSITCNSDGNVELYYDNSKKIETTNTGAVITGICTATGNVDIAHGTGQAHYQITQTSGNTVKFGIVSGSDVEISGSSNNNIVIKRAGADRFNATSSGVTFGGTDFGFNVTPGGTPASKNVFIAIGDSDTGIVQDGDGQLELWANATEVANINAIDGYTSTKPITTTNNVTIGDSIIHSGDTNTKIRFPSNDTVSVETGGDQRVEITSSATAVSTVLRCNSGFVSDTNLIFNSDHNANNSTNDSIIFQNGGNELARLKGNGRFGIGTNSPDHIFEVESNNSSIAVSRSAANAQLLFKSNSVGQAGQIQVDESSGGGVMKFYTKTTGGTSTERLRIDSNGRLTLNNSEGIKLSAVTSSLYNLDGALSYYSTTNGVYLNGAGASGWLRLQASGVTNSRTCIDLYGQSHGTADRILFKTAAAERFIIHGAGNACFGANFSSDADSTLQVNGTSNTNNLDLFRLRNTSGSAGTACSIIFENGVDDMARIQSYHDAGGSDKGGLRFWTAATKNTLTARMDINKDGVVQIGDEIGSIQADVLQCIHTDNSQTYTSNQNNAAPLVRHLTLRNPSNTTDTMCGLNFSASSAMWWVGMVKYSTWASSPLVFGNRDSGSTWKERVRIAGNGSLLIGTTSNSTIGGQTPLLNVDGYSNLGGLRVKGGDAGNTIWKTGGGMGLTVDGNHDMTFAVDSTQTVKIMGQRGQVCISNQDHGNVDYNHRGNRTLHSNGTGWDGNQSNDGCDPMLILSVADRSGNSDIGDAYGIQLHSESQDNNDYGPLIGWSNRSNSGNYNTTYACIVGQKTGQAVDTNWSSGALHFFTNKPAGHNSGYMNSTPDMSIDQDGNISMPRQSCFSATHSSHNQSGYINFNITVVNRGNDFSSGTYTCPKDGCYAFFFYGMAATSNQNLRVTIRINNASHSSGEHYGGVAYQKNGQYEQIVLNTILDLDQGDTVRIWWNSNYNTMHEWHCKFSGHFLG